MAIFLILGLVASHFASLGGRTGGTGGILGGPAVSVGYAVPKAEAIEETGPAALHGLPEVMNPDEGREERLANRVSLALAESGLRGGGGNGVAIGQSGVISYTVKAGDTLSRIAADFGLSVQTVIAANPEVRTRSLRAGEELSILPVSGVLYHVKEGETPESVAATFNVTIAQLREFNRSVDFNNFGSQTALIIPGASPFNTFSGNEGNTVLRDLKGYFIKPADGFNWGRLHPQNAVDIAGSCGTPILAAGEGLVVDLSEDDWSFGYGHSLIIEHPNGARTRYAHLDKIGVSLGDYMKQGDQIGTMGATGDATGCHIHFEVLGAKNPFARE